MITFRHIHRGSRRAFTLIESMATVVVLGTLAGTASLLVLNAVDSFTEATTAAQLHVETSIALDRAMREIRRIELDSAAAGIAPNIVGIGDTYVAWKDSDSDNYSFTYSAPSSVVYLQIDGGAGAVLLTDVTGVTVKAFDESNNELVLPLAGAACDPARRISIDIAVSRNGVSHSLRSKVFIRSTMSGGGS